jgi:hypothetical protein
MSTIVNGIKSKLNKLPLSTAVHSTYNFKRNIDLNRSLFSNFMYSYNLSHGSFKPTTLVFGSTKTDVLVLETLTGYYVRPTKPVFDYYFEEFFGFGCGCLMYRNNATTFVPAFSLSDVLKSTTYKVK